MNAGAGSTSDEEEVDGLLLSRVKSPLSDSPAAPSQASRVAADGGPHFVGWATWLCNPYEDSADEMDAKAEAAAAEAYPGARAASACEYTARVIHGLPATNDSGKVMVLRSPGNAGTLNPGAISGHKLQCLMVGSALDGSFTHGACGKGPRAVLCVVGGGGFPSSVLASIPQTQEQAHRLEGSEPQPLVREPEPEEEIRLDLSRLDPGPDPEPEPEPDPDSDSEPAAAAAAAAAATGGTTVGRLIPQGSLLSRLSSAARGGSAALVNTSTLAVAEYGGQEVTTMYHGTDSRAAQLIVSGQRFQPSTGGLLGDGVYVTRTRQKAEGYRVHHPNAAIPTNAPLPGGEPDPGCILQFRAQLGCCRTFWKDTASARTAWHEQEVHAADITPQARAAAQAAGIRVLRYNSAFSPGCPCCPRHGDSCPGNPEKDPRVNLLPGQEPCDGRCMTGPSCPKANSSFEEFCIHNSDRIDQIEIVDGPSHLIGYGRELWEASKEALAESFAAKQSEFERERIVAREAAAEATRALHAAVMAAGPALELAAHLEQRGSRMVAFRSQTQAREAQRHGQTLQCELLRQGGGVRLSCKQFDADDEVLTGIYTVFDTGLGDSLEADAVTLRRVGARHLQLRSDSSGPNWFLYDTSPAGDNRRTVAATPSTPRRAADTKPTRAWLRTGGNDQPVGTGARMWTYHNYSKVAVTLEHVTDEAVAECRRAESAKHAATVRRQLEDFGATWDPAAAIRVSGFDDANKNSLYYLAAEEHQGWMCARSFHEIHFFYSPRREAWCFAGELLDDEQLYAARDKTMPEHDLFLSAVLPLGSEVEVWHVDGGGDFSRGSNKIKLQLVTQQEVQAEKQAERERLSALKQQLQPVVAGTDGTLTLVLPSDIPWGIQFQRDDAKAGVVVSSLLENSPARYSGAQVGDYILRVGENRVEATTTAEDVARFAAAMKSSGGESRLVLYRAPELSQASRDRLLREPPKELIRIAAGRVWVRDSSTCTLWLRGPLEGYSQGSGAPLVRPTLGLPKKTEHRQISSTWGEAEALEPREWEELRTTPPGLTYENSIYTVDWGGWKIALAQGEYGQQQAWLHALARFLLLHVARPVVYWAIFFATADGSAAIECDDSNALVVEMHTGGPDTAMSDDYQWFNQNVRWFITSSADNALVCHGGPYYETWTTTVHSPPAEGAPAATSPCCLAPGLEYVLTCENTDGAGWYSGFLTVHGTPYCQSCSGQECYEQTHTITVPLLDDPFSAWSTGGVFLAIHEILFLCLSLVCIRINPGFFLVDLQSTWRDRVAATDASEQKKSVLAYIFLPQFAVWERLLSAFDVEFVETSFPSSFAWLYEIAGTGILGLLLGLELMALAAFFYCIGAGTMSVWIRCAHVIIVGSTFCCALYGFYPDLHESGDDDDFRMGACLLLTYFVLLPLLVGATSDGDDDVIDAAEVCATSCICIPELGFDGSGAGDCSMAPVARDSS